MKLIQIKIEIEIRERKTETRIEQSQSQAYVILIRTMRHVTLTKRGSVAQDLRLMKIAGVFQKANVLMAMVDLMVTKQVNATDKKTQRSALMVQ